MKTRTQTADLLKGIAALLMIQVHIIELFATTDIFSSKTGKLLLFLGGPPVAPVFLFFMGYFIAISNKTTTQLVFRGFKIIALGLALNIALNLNLLISVSRGKLNMDILPYIFGVDILPHAGLCIIIIALLKRISDKNILLPIIFTIAAAALGDMFLNYIPQQTFLTYFLAYFYGDSWWSYFPLFPWLSYSLAGMVFYRITQQYDFSLFYSLKAKTGLGLFFCLFLVFTIHYAISTASDLQAYYHHGAIFFFWTITFFLFYGFFINEVEVTAGTNILFRYLKWMGKNITAVYVIQWILIGNTATEIYKTVSSPLWLSFYFIAVLAASGFICFLWLKAKEAITQKTTPA